MIEPRIDKPANQLRICFSGRVDVQETRRWRGKLQELLSELQPGFKLVTDLTELASMDPECAGEIRGFMDLCNAKGVSLIVRVIPDPHKDIGFNILSLFHYRHGQRIVTCETLAEAERILQT